MDAFWYMHAWVVLITASSVLWLAQPAISRRLRYNSTSRVIAINYLTAFYKTAFSCNSCAIFPTCQSDNIDWIQSSTMYVARHIGVGTLPAPNKPMGLTTDLLAPKHLLSISICYSIFIYWFSACRACAFVWKPKQFLLFLDCGSALNCEQFCVRWTVSREGECV